MKVFIKIIKENLMSGERKIAATSFLTFVALDEQKKPITVPAVIPESEEEMKLFGTAPKRAEMRRNRREESKKFVGFLTVKQPWD